MPRRQQARSTYLQWDKKVDFNRDIARQFLQAQISKNPSIAQTMAHGGPLSSVYRKLHRAGYFGYSGLPDYLEHEIGVSPLKSVGDYLLPVHSTPESLRIFVQNVARKGTNMSGGNWSHNPGLGAVYRQLARNNFFGYGTFEKYLAEQVGIKRIKTVGRFEFPATMSKKFAIDFIRANANKSGLLLRTWSQTPGLSTVSYYVGKNKFFGHKSWRDFLEKEIGVLPVEHGKKYRKIKKTIEQIRKLAQTEEMTTTNWEHNKLLRNTYAFVQFNKFFGHGSWKAFLEKEVGLHDLGNRKNIRRRFLQTDFQI